jgi:hypothetical protein
LISVVYIQYFIEHNHQQKYGGQSWKKNGVTKNRKWIEVLNLFLSSSTLHEKNKMDDIWRVLWNNKVLYEMSRVLNKIERIVL